MALLSDLPLLDGMEAYVEGWADSVMLANAIGANNERPWSRYAGKEGAANELRELADLANSLGMAIRALRRESLEAMRRVARVNPHGLAGEIVALIQAADKGADLLTDPTANIDTSRPGSGERKVRAQKVALACAYAYQALTGKMPTFSRLEGKAKGPFLDFLSAAFSVFGIKASAEVQAKAAGKMIRQRH